VKDIPILLTDVTSESSTAVAMFMEANVPHEAMRNEQDDAGGPILITSTMTYRGLERIKQFIQNSR